MQFPPRVLAFALSCCLLASIAKPSRAEISIAALTKEQANEKYGITMHARRNGDAGTKVWLEFKQEGRLETFTYAELRMEDTAGNHLLSSQLRPNPAHHRQPKGVTSVAFSAAPEQLAQCSFLVVCYGSNEGDVGYYLRVKEFLDVNAPAVQTEASNDHSAHAQDGAPLRRTAGRGSEFLGLGEWWNLYSHDQNDAIKRSIRAVKIVQLNHANSSWIRIAFPRDSEEHKSIFGPVAKAHDDDNVAFDAVIAEWEESITEWKSIWINLDFVVSMSPVKLDQVDERPVAVD